MIKKLRLRFIGLTLITVFVVLFAIIASINFSNYSTVNKKIDENLNRVIEEGLIPPEEKNLEPQDDGKRPEPLPLSFIVAYNTNGTLEEFRYMYEFGLSQEECLKWAEEIYQEDDYTGGEDNFRFKKVKNSDQTTTIAIINVKDRLEDAHLFLVASTTISAGAFVFISVIVIGISHLVMRPTEKAYEDQKRFITNASHELKTPLTIISADVDLIEMDHGQTEWTRSIRDQVKSLTSMANDLVNLSLIQESITSFEFSQFPISEVVERIAHDYVGSCKKEGIQFTYEISQGLTYQGRQKLIDELINSLLNNMVKYTGGEHKEAKLTLKKDSKEKIILVISNTLEKDDEVDVKQMMERFYRSPSNKKQGSGIGLSVAKEIVHAHNGTINISKENDWITFTVTL